MTEKFDNGSKSNIDNNTPDSDIRELSDAFTSYMDNAINEEEINHISNTLHGILHSDIKEVSKENDILDEDTLSKQFDDGYFEKKEKDSIKLLDDIPIDISENKEKRIFYTSLFLSGKPVEINILKKMLNPLNLENRLIDYAEEFNNLKIGVRIRMVSGGYQLVADSDVTVFLEKYFGEKTESLSRASLETAAIIAYRQPVTKAEVEEMREVNSSGTMKYLLDKNLIKVVGRKQVPGKPLLYATTKFFLEYFGLNDLSELPTFREWQELKQNL